MLAVTEESLLLFDTGEVEFGAASAGLLPAVGLLPVLRRTTKQEFTGHFLDEKEGRNPPPPSIPNFSCFCP